MNSNEAILNKLIELGVEQNGGHYKHADGSFISMKRFDPIAKAHDAELIKQALFDVCGDKYDLLIRGNILTIFERNKMQYEEDPDAIIHQGDTSRESFKAAFEKVVGI